MLSLQTGIFPLSDYPFRFSKQHIGGATFTEEVVATCNGAHATHRSIVLLKNMVIEQLLETMKKRKLQRAKKSTGNDGIREDVIITTKAENTARAATRGEPTIDCIGNFIFFSTPSGEGWMLDHRKNYALRLAENYTILTYRIVENSERFQVEWKERFRLEGDLFIAIRKGEETIFREYPVEALTGLIALIKEKRQNPLSFPPGKPH